MTENENLESVSQQEQLADNAELIEALTEMNKTHVKKELYDRMKADRDRLISAVVKGEKISVEAEEKPNIPQLRKELFKASETTDNLTYIKTALNLRKALIENGERDPFLPYGEKVQVNQSHYDTAENVAAVLQECVDFADGDSGIFTAELQRRTKDVMPRFKGR